MKTKILADIKICISLPLTSCLYCQVLFCYSPKFILCRADHVDDHRTILMSSAMPQTNFQVYPYIYIYIYTYTEYYNII